MITTVAETNIGNANSIANVVLLRVTVMHNSSCSVLQSQCRVLRFEKTLSLGIIGTFVLVQRCLFYNPIRRQILCCDATGIRA